jgi:hypothetical protein
MIASIGRVFVMVTVSPRRAAGRSFNRSSRGSIRRGYNVRVPDDIDDAFGDSEIETGLEIRRSLARQVAGDVGLERSG